MTKLWQKNTSKFDKNVEEFLSGKDVYLDDKLCQWDVFGSLAHISMLYKINILEKDEYSLLKNELISVLNLSNKNKFKISSEDEDVHTKIENYITSKIGDVGKKIHTGRSRNDQVLVDLRLYSKFELLNVIELAIKLSETMLSYADKYSKIPMPGYTHMQKAMPSSVGMWFSAYGESILDDIKILCNSLQIIDQNPLGSGASYGIPLPIDRELTTNLLGFNQVQNNSLYCQNSRGKFEGLIVNSLSLLLYDVSKFASDILLFTTSEYNYFSISDIFTTGSSIMPQKRNWDVAELLRSKFNVINGYYFQIITTSSNLPSGYNRDFQDTKEALMNSFDMTKSSVEILLLFINSLTVNEEELNKSMSSELYATHAAIKLTNEGMPFREAYGKIGNSLHTVEKVEFSEVLSLSKHIGSIGNLAIDNKLLELGELKKLHNKAKVNFNNKLDYLIK
jgi:argininosuccinate lyase